MNYYFILGFVNRRTQERPPLKSAYKRERMQFALAYLNNEHDDWVFADETKAESHRTKLYHMRKKGRYPKKVGKYKPDRFKVNVWGAISARGACKFVVS